jgi:hypothetical protein
VIWINSSQIQLPKIFTPKINIPPGGGDTSVVSLRPAVHGNSSAIVCATPGNQEDEFLRMDTAYTLGIALGSGGPFVPVNQYFQVLEREPQVGD